MIFFSIVIPVFNRAEKISPTLQSVLRQDFTDWECLVVDDGSSDGSKLKQFVEELGDPRVRYIRRGNGGASAARNTGIEAALGRYIAFLDSDDLFLPNKLKTDYELLNSISDPRVVIFSPVLVDRGAGKRWILPRRGPKTNEPIAEYLIRHLGFTQTSTIVVERELARTVGFRVGLPMGQDVDFPIMLERAGARFVMKALPTSIWLDAVSVDRVSNSPPFEPMLDWVAEMRATIGDRCFYAFRATHIARLAAPQNKKLALKLLLQGIVRFALPPKLALKAIAQVLLPRTRYRALFDWFVRMRRLAGGQT
ncbi:MAG: glycosyltransferase [Alphaproteobacteria bacterium]|jgi:glycosyltransferase involved in cell wall biosynthesis|nr:glycosyltransferase [Alphaproteobacteria bacterium]MBU1548497.1 glycosyltransferase [Alphaproteobacteria bacterium]MBU2337693.1 glycosyltransferase [Alphaproteobacteria bacterium]MBU2389830.1 glycosyltransferase [Alphaproteobacteria bacterium]